MTWQKRARVAVAVFGVAVAVIVYFAIGRRPAPAQAVVVKRLDPAATAESVGGHVQRFRSDKRDFVISYEAQLTYADGTTRMKVVTVTVTKDDGRSYVVKAGEALSTQDQSTLQLSSGVTFRSSDGLELVTDRASYDKDRGAMHSDAPVTFTKGRLHGAGTSVDYSETNDVLTIGREARVASTDGEGTTTLDFTAGSAELNRLADTLTLDGGVHVLRDAQVMDADRATAHLTADEDAVTFIELRGSSRVEGGGGSLDAMSARDIDLDYSDDGVRLERVVLDGEAAVALAATGGAGGRQLMGDSLDLMLAPDGSVASAAGRTDVRMILPAAAGAPARTISGQSLDATGAPGRGLTAARFGGNVEYREDGSRSGAARTIRSRSLDLALADDVVSNATFTNDVTFEEPSFRAQAATARYDPAGGTLHLTGRDDRGLPCVADDQISVDAQTIDVAVESRRLAARGGVKTSLRPSAAARAAGSSPCAIARQRSAATAARAAGDESSTRLPGLLKQDEAAVATADALEYDGTGKPLTYTGNALLVQGKTSVRGDVIRIDQEAGDLVITGNARYLTEQETAEGLRPLDGRADEIRYTESARQVQYLNAPAGATPANEGKRVQLNGPEGDLTAARVDVILGGNGTAERIEAYRNVTARIGKRTATADRLTYVADQAQYDLRGAGAVPARLVMDGCLETSGKALTLFTATNRIIVDGKDEVRARTQNSACQPPSGSPR